ncbi:hypothetical protein [Pulveribacter suum]|uniref:Uncharacterized protein n=1 Tax=Pulveribacter suum TaxID=2116657 RepID=A0A2P1NJP6_9BURK|nr:hypothetical protein [Pulveribacter suum]AVP57299.1 hypothetical protein C7H73_06170 [Pulveribacter suum]
MAGWLSALKLVPWGQVVGAAPQIVQGARKLMSRGEQQHQQQAPQPPVAVRHEGTAEQLAQLQQQLTQLQEEQRASAVLIRSLAEQNAQVVRAVDALRVRSRWLMGASALLGVATVGLLGWVLSH